MADLTIWKKQLQPIQLQTIDVPRGAVFLCAREQFEQACVWFKCDPSAPLEMVALALVGTGNPMPADGRYLGTAFLQGGTLVLHVFEGPRQ
jgi:hypothetical protein